VTPDDLDVAMVGAPDQMLDPAIARARCHRELLAALDYCVAAAATSRGIDACGGLDDDHAAMSCDIGELHTTAGMLAYRLTQMIANPDVNACDFELAAFHAALRARFKP